MSREDAAELPELTSIERLFLLHEARRSVDAALRTGVELAGPEGRCPAPLLEPWASFVTVHLDGDLRGCIGSTSPTRALIDDVKHNAFAAVMFDRRFEPIELADVARVEIHISILSALEAIPCSSEADLLRQLRPGRDGLVIEDGEYRATFLPAMWEQLGTAESFLRHLEEKAGLPSGHWSPQLRAFRYAVASVK